MPAPPDPAAVGIRVEDAVALCLPSHVAIGPNGSDFAFVSRPAGLPAGTGGVLQLVTGETAPQALESCAVDGQPAWSPDGGRLSFVADPKGQRTLRVRDLSRPRGEDVPTPGLTPSWPEWLSDTEIAFIDQEPGQLLVGRANGGRSVEPASTALSGLYVHSHAWSPDGRRACLLVSEDGTIDSVFGGRARLAVLDRATDELVVVDESRSEYRSCHVTPSSLAWSSDSEAFAFLAGQDVHSYDAAHVFTVRSSDGWLPRLRHADGAGSVIGVAWLDGDRLALERVADCSTGVWSLDADSSAPRPLFPDSQRGSTAFELADPGPLRKRITFAGEIALGWSTPDDPPEVWSVRAGEPPRRRTTLNPSLTGVSLAGRTATVSWPAPDGLEIQGLIVSPRDAEPPHATVVALHGGPAQSWDLGFQANVYMWAQLLAARSIATFLPNPRGSTGRGGDFETANLGDWMGADCEDVLSGVDALVERGIADPGRLAIGGSSYGGYSTASILTRTDRFRAAVVSSGVSNLVAALYTSDIPSWLTSYWPETQCGEVECLWRRSPVRQAARIGTPTLILHGGADPRLPPSQAVELYGALRLHGVPCRLTLYPDETHDYVSADCHCDYLTQVLDWFAEHLDTPGAVSPD